MVQGGEGGGVEVIQSPAPHGKHYRLSLVHLFAIFWEELRFRVRRAFRGVGL
jgi:hypothetical protein